MKRALKITTKVLVASAIFCWLAMFITSLSDFLGTHDMEVRFAAVIVGYYTAIATVGSAMLLVALFLAWGRQSAKNLGLKKALLWISATANVLAYSIVVLCLTVGAINNFDTYFVIALVIQLVCHLTSFVLLIIIGIKALLAKKQRNSLDEQTEEQTQSNA